MYKAFELIADTFGMFDQGSGPNGAHYMTEDQNPFKNKGMICANCVFYEGGQGCEIVEGNIQPLALCKLWIISKALLDEDLTKASYTPPEGVRNAARQALKWIADGQAGDGFTATGRYRAETLAAGRSVSLDTIKRMNSFFARHEVDKKGEGWDSSSPKYPSAGRVAWAAWGGDAGWTWAKSILADAEVEKRQFGSRSAAGAYAASVRWGNRGSTKIGRGAEVDALTDTLLEGDGTENLRDYDIEGTPFFAAPDEGKARLDMPQIPSQHKQEFLDEVSSRGVSVRHESVEPSSLIPTQSEINGKASAEILRREEKRGFDAFQGSPKDSIVVSSDGFVMDGHHRWAGAALAEAAGRPTLISIVRIGAPRAALEKLMRAFGERKGIRALGFGEHTRKSTMQTSLAFTKAVDLALAAQKEYLSRA